MRVSVHICAKDRATELTELLVSLRAQTKKDWDLVIVDGSQPMPLKDYIKFVRDALVRIACEGHGVQYIRENVPMGVCQARNKAMTESEWKSELVARIDDDSILEPDWLERLAKLIEPEWMGAAGGIVPTYGAPPVIRNVNKLNAVFNRVKFDQEGNIDMKDDGGFQYHPDIVLPSHHLRSSFLFKREAWEKAGGFPTEYGPVGFREETDFCLKLLMNGYKLVTDTGAIAWHNTCPSGGVRAQNYMEQVMLADKKFRRKFKHYWDSKKLTKEHLTLRIG